MHSFATRGSGKEISEELPRAVELCKLFDFDLIVAETSGIGQADSAITDLSDLSLYVMTSEFGAQSQLEKIDMIDLADFIAVNKADKKGSKDALRDVRKQYKRSRKLFDASDESLPIFLTKASQFNDSGIYDLFFCITEELGKKSNKWVLSKEKIDSVKRAHSQVIIPADRQNYLGEITHSIRRYKDEVKKQSDIAKKTIFNI